MSAGGAAGGLAVGLLAPFVFNGYFELPLAILACLLVCIGTYLRDDKQFQLRVPQATTLKFGLTLVSVFFVYFAFFAQHSDNVRDVERNFYGVLRVEDDLQESNSATNA